MEIDLINKCRACLRDDKEMHYLFNEFDQGISLRDILISTTGFEVEEDDGFPSYLCQSCTTIVVDFYNLKTIYEDNETQMKAVLSNCCEISSEEQPKPEVSSTTITSLLPTSKQKCDVELKNSQQEDCITIKIETCSDESSDDASQSNQDQCEEADVSNGAIEGSQTQESDEAVNFEYQEIKTFTCPECGDCFLYKNDIQAHMLTKHDTEDINYEDISEVSLLKVEKQQEPVSETTCKVCRQKFETIDECKKHMEIHKKNVCDVCGIGFIKKSYLKDHLEIHCPEKRHVCNYCNKAFKRRTVLVKHKRIHTHPRQCVCEICGKAFNDKGTLKTHIMLLHVRERNYMCLICGVKFPLKGTLEKHIRRHQNKEREFFCTQCPLGYRDKSSLDRHIYVKHSGQNVKSTCSDCGKQYTTISNLFKHQRSCHGTECIIEESME